jgi:Domain of unknown function (DUF4304)
MICVWPTVGPMASPSWPAAGRGGRVMVAVRFAGLSAEPVEEVRRLVESWRTQRLRDGADSTRELERPPWLELTSQGVEVVFESRPGNQRWKGWMASLVRWSGTFSEEMHPVAIVDRVSGEVRPIYVSRPRSANPSAGPVRNSDWAPGQGRESVQMLYREMMNSAIAPLLKSHGFRRAGQQFNRTTNGYHEYFGFQKSVHNTKYEVSFTVNVGVHHPVAEAEHGAAHQAAYQRWGAELSYFSGHIYVVSTVGRLSDRLGDLTQDRVPWWTFRDRVEMEQAAHAVTTAITEVALPMMAAESAKPFASSSYRIEATTRSSTEQLTTQQLWPPLHPSDENPTPRTPPHTWPSTP